MKTVCLFSPLLGLLAPMDASELILNTSNGDSYYLDIQKEDTFQDVVATLQLIEEKDPLHFSVDAFHINFDPANGSFQAKIKENISIGRNYYTTVDAKTAESIHYLLTSLAYQSLIKISGKKSSLNKAGDLADELHPLRFLLHIFSHDELLVCMRNIRDRSLLWKEFSGRLCESLQQEGNIGNITIDQIQDVASKLGLDANLLNTPIQTHDWNGLLDTLIKNVDRNGDSKRYDM